MLKIAQNFNKNRSQVKKENHFHNLFFWNGRAPKEILFFGQDWMSKFYALVSQLAGHWA